MALQPYDGDQIRELVNTEQIYAALLAAETERDRRFRGSIAWKRVAGREYLYRKRRADWRSLGPRNEDTERLYESFVSGRDQIKKRLASLDARLRRSARVNRALNLGRVPFIAARIIRRLADEKLLGSSLLIIGTPALFVYERMAGGQLQSSLVATADLDLLLDAREGMRMMSDRRKVSLIKLLRSVDDSFMPVGGNAFRAANDHGYMVDLVAPMPPNASTADPARLGPSGDLEAAEIEGLDWLQNSPRVRQTIIDEKGFPLEMVVPDPRAFAVHKLWLSKQPSRDRTKARRDREQARAVAGLIEEYLPHLEFDRGELDSFPANVRRLAAELKQAMPSGDSAVWR
jgi:hypothetical protein